MYPIAPLYDSIEKTLMPDYERALLRIFRICDADGDGIMDDQDMTSLQQEVYGQELQKTHLTALKQIIVNDFETEDAAAYDESKAMKGFNFEGFKILMKKSIQKMKGQMCWRLLKHFGYENTL